MIGQSERTDILAMRWSIDALRVEVRMLQLRLALRRYDPSQPRMPAGTGEGGQWTRAPASGVRVAQNTPRDPRTGRPVGALWPTASQAQLTRLSVAEARAQAARERVERVNPSWRPTPSLYETIEGAISSAEAVRIEAEARYLLLQNVGVAPGPYAAEWIPSRGPTRSFRVEERKEINRIGYQYGCHTCGIKSPGISSGNFIPDHLPPISWGAGSADGRMYPHCIACSRRQGGWLTGNEGK